MGLRYRKSIRIMKGVSINFSKSGASLSLGGRGHSVNIGKRGIRTTVGIPGTGLSYSSSSGGRKSVSNRKVVRKGQQSVSFRVHMAIDGKVTILDPATDKPITDEGTLRRIRSSQAYKDIKEQLEKLRKELAEIKAKQAGSEKAKKALESRANAITQHISMLSMQLIQIQKENNAIDTV